MTALFSIALVLAVWTGLTQHKTIQEQERQASLQQLSLVATSLLRDLPSALAPWAGRPVMIGRIDSTAYCATLAQNIEVSAGIEEVFRPYLREIPYDTDTSQAQLSGWYLNLSGQQLILGSCISDSKPITINY